MKKRNELVLFGLLLVAALLVGLAVFQTLLASQKSNRANGDPNDVTKLVQRSVLLAPDRPSRGPADAPFTLVEFGDFECASCMNAQPIVLELLKKRSDVRLVFRHCPISSKHPIARMASQIAEAARKQDKFWPVYDALYENQQDWTESEDPRKAIEKIAAGAGVDLKQATKDASGGEMAKYEQRINEDLAAADACSVQTTPSFFLITPNRTWAVVGAIGLIRLRDDARYWQ